MVNMNDKIKNALENNKTVEFKYNNKVVKVIRDTTLSELQELYGFELDILDLARAEWHLEGTNDRN